MKKYIHEERKIFESHRQELSVCAIYCSFHSMGEKTHHTAVHCAVLWSSGEGLNTRPHTLDKEEGRRIQEMLNNMCLRLHCVFSTQK